MKNENLKEISSEEFWVIYGEMLEKGVNLAFVTGMGNMNFKLVQKDGFELLFPEPGYGYSLSRYIPLKLKPGMALSAVYVDVENDCFILEGFIKDAIACSEVVPKENWNITDDAKFTANCTFLSRIPVSSLLH